MSNPEKGLILKEQAQNAARTCFSGNDGVFLFKYLMGFCGTFDPNSGTDAVSIARAEGRRDVGLEISRLFDSR